MTVAAKTPLPKKTAPTKLGALFEGRRVLRAMKWPGTDLDLKLRVLSCEEIQEAVAAAYRRFEALRLPVDVASTANQFEDETLTQLLCLACRDPEDLAQTFAVDADDLRAHTTVDQRAAVYAAYLDLADEVDPEPALLSKERYDAILDALKKKDRARLRDFGSGALSSFLLTTESPPES